MGREGQTWTVDPSSALAYVFGGRGPHELNDLWAYDLSSDAWTKITPAGTLPPARADHIAVWIDGLGLVIAGGRSGTKVLDDLWAYDPNANAWRTLATSGARPDPRSGACAAVRTDGRLWLAGGAAADGTLLADVWSYDPAKSAWTKVAIPGAAPEARDGASCWWTVDDRFAVYGGHGATAGALGDLWTLQGAGTNAPTWADAGAPAAPPRSRAAASVATDSIVVAGGADAAGKPLSDVVAFDAQTLVARLYTGGSAAGATPDARFGASLIDDPGSERLVMFGGKTASASTAEVWSLTLQ